MVHPASSAGARSRTSRATGRRHQETGPSAGGQASRADSRSGVSRERQPPPCHRPGCDHRATSQVSPMIVDSGATWAVMIGTGCRYPRAETITAMFGDADHARLVHGMACRRAVAQHLRHPAPHRRIRLRPHHQRAVRGRGSSTGCAPPMISASMPGAIAPSGSAVASTIRLSIETRPTTCRR